MRGSRAKAYGACMLLDDHMSAAAWIVTIAFALGVLALIAVLIATLAGDHAAGESRDARGRSDSPDAHARVPNVRELLDRRLASGELGEDEYRRLRMTLGDAVRERRAIEMRCT